MSLLPKCPQSFDKKSFWDTAYKSSDGRPFEWYADFEDLLPVFVKYLRRADKILNVGCGNSDLGASLANSGWDQVTNIDISETVISKMKAQYPHGDYQQMDATKMTFETDSFDCAVDKGTIGAMKMGYALLPKHSDEGCEVVKRMIAETMRVLKPSGRLLIVSLAQKHVVETLKSHFEREVPCSYVIRAHHLPQRSNENVSFALPVFVFIVMKMKMNLPNPIFELQSRPGLHLDSNMRCPDGASWASGVLAHQVVQYNIRSSNSRFPPRAKPTEHFDVVLELGSSSKSLIGGFRLFVVDKPGPASLKFAVFVVPCGREIDELYSTVEGRNNLADAVSCGRLLVCCMIPRVDKIDFMNGEGNISLDEVTQLLNEGAISLAPPSFIPGTDNAPYLTEAAPSSGESSPNKQKLGTLCVKSSGKALRIVDIEASSPGFCKNVGKNKKKKSTPGEAKKILRLVETNPDHLSCIAQVCSNHTTSSNWNCQQLPANCTLYQALEGEDKKKVLQIGDDFGHLFGKATLKSEGPVQSWTRFCTKEESTPEDLKKEMRYPHSNSQIQLKNVETLPLGENFSVVVVLVSCTFVRSIELLERNIATVAQPESKVILVRCCREPTKELIKLENSVRSGVKKSNLFEIDITETIGDWSN